MFDELLDINKKPEPYEHYTAEELWTGEHTSRKMLEYHLDRDADAASRNHAFIEKSCEWMIGKFNIGSGTRVVDFGCGPGLYTSRLAKTGAQVTGLDFSGRSLAYAKQEAAYLDLEIDYVQTNYLAYETDKKYDLIMMIMCDFCALSHCQRGVLLSKFRTMLEPGGSVLLDVYSCSYFDKRHEKSVYEFNQLDGFWSEEDYYCFMNTFKYDDEKLVLDKYTVYTGKDRRTIYNWLQCFSEQAIRRLFLDHGLVITSLFSNVAGDAFDPGSDEFAVVAEKS